MFMIVGTAAASSLLPVEGRVPTSLPSVVEVRGPVYSGSQIEPMIDVQGGNEGLNMNSDSFATFFYDTNDKVTTGTLSIKK